MSAHLEDSSAVRVEFAPLGVTIALLLAAILVAAIVLVIWKRRRALTPAAVLLIAVIFAVVSIPFAILGILPLMWACLALCGLFTILALCLPLGDS